MRIDEVIEQMRVQNYKFVEQQNQSYNSKLDSYIEQVKKMVYELVSEYFPNVGKENLDGFVDLYLSNELHGNQLGNNNQLGYRLDEAIRSFERQNENLKNTNRAASSLRMLINEQARNVSFDQEREISKRFASSLRSSLLKNSNGQYEKEIEEIYNNLMTLMMRKLEDLFADYQKDLRTDSRELISKYDDVIIRYTETNGITYDKGEKTITSEDLEYYEVPLRRMGYHVVVDNNEVMLGNGLKQKKPVVYKGGIISTVDSEVILRKVKDGVYGVYDAKTDTMCTIGDPNKDTIKYFHTQSKGSIALEDTFLEYAISRDGVKAKTKEEQVEMLSAFEREFPRAFRELADYDLIFKYQLNGISYESIKKKEVSTVSQEEIESLINEVESPVMEDEMEITLGSEPKYKVGLKGVNLDAEIKLLEQDASVQRYLYLVSLRDLEQESVLETEKGKRKI